MFQSHVVEAGGTFIGAAIVTATGFRFRAVHMKVEELDESTWRSLEELRRAVLHLFTTGRLSAARDLDADNPRQNAAFLAAGRTLAQQRHWPSNSSIPRRIS